MTILFVILIVLASAVLSLIVLVQNPKGGGLAGSIGGFSNQFMGVKQTTDVLEKGTWLFGGVIAALCLLSTIFISKTGTTAPDRTNDVKNVQIPTTQQPVTAPNTTIPNNATPLVPDTSKH